MRTGRALRGVTPAKLLTSLAAVTLVGVAAVSGTRAVLSDTTENPGNEFDAGEIVLSDNDSGGFLYQVDNVAPGDDAIEACIQVSYTSTPDLAGTVRLYLGSSIGDVGPYVDLTIDVGTQESPLFPGCAEFVPSDRLYTGTLSDFSTTHGTAGSGLEYSPRGSEPWTDGDSVVYRLTLDLRDETRPTGANFSGPHTYTWHADTL